MKRTEQRRNPGILRNFAAYYKPHLGMFIGDMACALVIALIDLIFPMVTRYSVQNLLPDGEFRLFFIFIGALVFLYLLRMLMQFVVTYVGHDMGVRMEADMRRDVFTHLQRLSFSYYDNTRTGQLMSRVTTDLFEVTELAHHGPEDLFISIVTIVGAFIALFSIQWKLALVIFIAIPLIIWYAIHFRGKMSMVSRDVKSKTAMINANLESSISGVRVAQAFANEDYEIEKFMDGNAKFRVSKRNYYRIMAFFHSGMEFLTSIIYVLVLAVGGYLILRGEMQTVELLTFTLYINTFLTPIRKLTNFAEQYTAGIAGFERMQEIMNVEPNVKDKKNAPDLANVKGRIQFKDVSFGYDSKGSTEVLSRVNLDINPGEMVALVGPSGGGKSTLCQLIPRFYDVLSGSVNIDGTDVRDVTLHSLRDNIGIVQQDVFLFAGTVWDNIRYGNLDAPEADVMEAAKRAEIHDFIMTLPDGYDTNVGERGVMLSGGQKQRISIARIFLKNPPILILDEATSALDTQTETRIQAALDELAKGRTTLVVAHRLSTIKNADEIVVVGEQTILERGSHEELLTKGGEYAALYNASALATR